jgi:hypothetical protein
MVVYLSVMLFRVFEFIFVGKFLVCVRVCFPCLMIHLCWCLFTARLKISTSPHWHFFCYFFFSGDNTAVRLTRLFHGQSAPTKNYWNYSPSGYYTPHGTRVSDVSEENSASILSVKRLPNQSFTLKMNTAWSPKHLNKRYNDQKLTSELQSMCRSCTRTTIHNSLTRYNSFVLLITGDNNKNKIHFTTALQFWNLNFNQLKWQYSVENRGYTKMCNLTTTKHYKIMINNLT